MKIPFFTNVKFNPKALIIVLRLLAFSLILYIFLMPYYPKIAYEIENNEEYISESKNIDQVSTIVETIINQLPQNEYAVSPNRLIIPKINVNAPITETDNEEYGLSLGAWMYPKGSSPEKGGNTILTGHRFKYLPPSNLTFYLFDKLEIGDIATVIWKEKTYYYKITNIKVVKETDLSPYDKSDKPILTMFTCDPIFSTKNRLVITSELIEEK